MVSVKLERATKAFGEVVAVREVTLEMQQGELFFILGPSGCGKTTVLRMIAGFYLPTSGRILFDDREMSQVPPHKRNTGMVFQNYALWPHMTVWENVEYGLNLRKVPSNEKQRRVREALDVVRMGAYADRSPNQLSGGQQQRVALARALVINPDVVLLDEPLSNLDAKLRVEMREEIRRIHDEVGTTMVYVTHDQKEALSMADRIAVMDMGAVVQVGDPRTIYTRPANRFVADFIGETNFLEGTVVQSGTDLLIETPVGPLRSTASTNVYRPGDRVLCSVRPESIRVESDRPAADGVNRLAARVTHVMYLGDYEQYILMLPDGTQIKAVEANPTMPKARMGDEIRLTFGPESVIVLAAG